MAVRNDYKYWNEAQQHLHTSTYMCNYAVLVRGRGEPEPEPEPEPGTPPAPSDAAGERARVEQIRMAILYWNEQKLGTFLLFFSLKMSQNKCWQYVV